MTVQYTSSKNSLNKSIPSPSPNYADWTPVTYTRPSDWLSLPAMTTSDQKFYGLVAIYDDDANFLAMTIGFTAGTVTIDWGDGTTDTPASLAQANHAYTYSSISSGTLTTRGYRQALVTVSITGGNITSINLQNKYTGAAITGTWTTGTARWLDVKMGGPSLSTVIVGSNGPTVWLGLLEQFELVKGSSSGIGCTNAFRQLPKLQNFIWHSGTPIASGTFMFGNCFGLQTISALPLSGVTNLDLTGMFNLCYNLRYVADMNFTGSTTVNLNQMFQQCYNLKRAPNMTGTSGVTNTSSMFVNCQDLQYIPTFDTSNVTTMNAMFSGCRALVTAPYLNTQNVTDFTNMFNSCGALKNIPAYNYNKATTLSQTFINCYALEYVPAMNIPNVTTLASTFNSCYSLVEIQGINSTANLTTMTSTFLDCRLLDNPPLFNTTGVTTMLDTFRNCYSLSTVPNYVTTNNTSLGNTFNSCSSLLTAPALDTTKVANTQAAFTNCSMLSVTPAYNLSNVTNASSMFSGCPQITTVNSTLNLANVTNTSSMFTGCYALKDANNIANTGNNTNTTGMFSSCFNLLNAPTMDTSKVTTFTNMFNTCQALESIPAYNMANATSVTAWLGSAWDVSSVLATGCKVPVSYASLKLQKTALELIETNLGTTASLQLLTIGPNPGADTAVSTTATYNITSNSMTVASATGLSVGMFAYGVSAASRTDWSTTASTDIVQMNGGTMTNGTRVSFATGGVPGGLTAYTIYYAVNSSGTTFQLSLTPGGSVIDITTGGPCTILYEYYITNIAGNTLTMNATACVAGSGAAVSFRKLNTHIARLKQWNVSG